ncbi:hypothetical protein BKA69DRAFT_607198 [Paraphysoderma sedebokerense]|nr:hypothetical protein BKA69DRAFT_607198 [Paraphysoderma sedebokerense]
MMTQAHHDISYSTRDDDPSNDTLMSATDDSLKSSKLNVSNHNDESRQSPPTNDINRISENQPSSHNSTAIYKLHNSQKSVDSKSPSIPSANSKNRQHLQLDVEDGSDLSSVNSDGLSDLSESEDGDDGQRINDSGSDEDSVGNVTDNSDGSTVYSSSPPRRNAKPRSRSHSSSSSIDYTSSSNTDLSSSSVNSDDDIEGEQSSLRNPSHKSKSHTSRGRGHRRRGRPPKVHSISRSAHSSPPSSRQTSPSGHQKKPSSLHRRPGRRSTTNPDHFDIEDVHRRDRSGRTPIFRFAVKGDLEAVNKLIQAGADVNVKDYAGWVRNYTLFLYIISSDLTGCFHVFSDFFTRVYCPQSP